MANVWINESILQGWADTIREKTGGTEKMLPSELLTITQGMGYGVGFDGSDPNLQNFVYQIDTTNRQVILYGVLDSASDIEIPDTMGGYAVVINSEASYTEV